MFKIVSPQKPVIICAPDEKTKQAWLDAIVAALQTVRAQRQKYVQGLLDAEKKAQADAKMAAESLTGSSADDGYVGVQVDNDPSAAADDLKAGDQVPGAGVGAGAAGAAGSAGAAGAAGTPGAATSPKAGPGDSKTPTAASPKS